MRELMSNVALGLGSQSGDDASETEIPADSIRFSIWDMAGQTVFYDLQHLLLSRYAVYLVCFDLADLQSNPADCLAYVRYWLDAIHLHASGAPVLLVGTHKDLVPNHTQH